MKKLLFMVIFYISLIAGLVVFSTQNPTPALGDSKWFLRSYDEQNNLIPIIEGSEITATFDDAENRISGSAGCNTYFAGFEAEDNIMSIS